MNTAAKTYQAIHLTCVGFIVYKVLLIEAGKKRILITALFMRLEIEYFVIENWVSYNISVGWNSTHFWNDRMENVIGIIRGWFAMMWNYFKKSHISIENERT